MIDLDLVLTEEQELYCQFGVLYFERKINYEDWKRITETFGVHDYIYPHRRICNPATLQYLAQVCGETDNLMHFVTGARNIEAHYTEEEQARIVEIIVANKLIHSGAAPMDPSPDSMV